VGKESCCDCIGFAGYTIANYTVGHRAVGVKKLVVGQCSLEIERVV